MYSRQNRNGREEISVELPRDYSGNAFSSFSQYQTPPLRGPRVQPPCEPKREEHPPECREKEECTKDECEKCECEKDECKKEEECCKPEPIDCPPQKKSFGLEGLKGIFGGNIGLEELLLLGVIFLIFTDEDLRDNELLICLLLILFI